ncbi:MAG: hypothetical protein Q8O42_20165 [Acidobacteriota bacterium]|nr:hypothetical protein [Acidobacteriota bacterium]
MRLAFGLVLASVLLSTACGNLISRKYEYEEEIFLALDGSASVYVNASVPALVALRGATLPLDPAARLDRRVVQEFFASPVTEVASVTTSRRDGRRYVHLRINVTDIRKLGEAAAFAWSQYRYQDKDDLFEFGQTLGASAGKEVGNVGWRGGELVAIRVHLPSRVEFHNSPSRTIDRGNIIVWEQPLAERLKGTPLELTVRMQTESILFRTLALFGMMMVAAALTFAAAIWFVKTRKTGVKEIKS